MASFIELKQDIRFTNGFMVSVAQLVELRIVIPAVVGSSPIVHPNIFLFSLWEHIRMTRCMGASF
jgi:hypothetical protein